MIVNTTDSFQCFQGLVKGNTKNNKDQPRQMQRLHNNTTPEEDENKREAQKIIRNNTFGHHQKNKDQFDTFYLRQIRKNQKKSNQKLVFLDMARLSQRQPKIEMSGSILSKFDPVLCSTFVPSLPSDPLPCSFGPFPFFALS
jgi:hypothetical protein